MKTGYFSGFHPFVLLVYFICSLLITMFTLSPIILGISFICALGFYGVLAGGKKLGKSCTFLLPIGLLATIINPLFTHNGETILFYIGDMYITLEATLYGGAVGLMIMAVCMWFLCYNEVMSSDKFIYLFGRVMPKISIMLSMSMRFVPTLKRQYNVISRAHKAMGLYSSRSFFSRIRAMLKSFSALVTYALENSVDTADSMRARGYGLKKRTSFGNYRWQLRDTFIIIFMLAISIFVVTTMALGYGGISFYPTIQFFDFSQITIILYFAVAALMTMALALEAKEGVRWQLLKSKI